MRDFIYTEAKEEFDKQHWSAAYEKFEDVVHEGKGEDWRHTKKVVPVTFTSRLAHLAKERDFRALSADYDVVAVHGRVSRTPSPSPSTKGRRRSV